MVQEPSFSTKIFLPASYYLIIRSFLENRNFIIHYDNSTSSYYQIKAEVLQGSMLSLNVCAADIPKTPNIILAAYTDDTVIL